MSVRKLQSSGTMDPGSAVGQTGRVYLTIKPGQVGKVELAVSQHLSIMDARSDEVQALPTDTTVRVLRVENGSLLVVEPIVGK
ncbi:MAG: NfeD family protein [Planctomycetes bacterium]|nr:NfeD family protein [Planctomycetota bacterium]